jgi:anaerobic magnesium-protoporphyrin IX monomethyl ester cyclase
MTGGLLKKMKKAGCTYLVYGVESGSDEVLSMMNKRINRRLIVKTLRRTHSAGIKANINMIIGFPTETEHNFRESLDLIKKNKKYINFIYAGGGCTIPENADVGRHPEKYGVYWKKKLRHWDWYSRDTTPELRKTRLRTFVDFCKEFHLGVQSNL